MDFQTIFFLWVKRTFHQKIKTISDQWLEMFQELTLSFMIMALIPTKPDLFNIVENRLPLFLISKVKGQGSLRHWLQLTLRDFML